MRVINIFLDMEEKMTARERLAEILRREGEQARDCFRDENGAMTVAQFAREIGKTNDQTLRDIMKGRTRNISATLAKRIHNAKPKYLLEWLLTGEGPMLNPDAPRDRVIEPRPLSDRENSMNALIDMLAQERREKQQMLLRFEKERDRLTKEKEKVEQEKDSLQRQLFEAQGVIKDLARQLDRERRRALQPDSLKKA